jgi:Photoprotection regulator fluorescence recovery protein
MLDSKWTGAEQRLARRLFDAALQAELAQTLAEFKSKAAAASSVEAMWPLEDYLRGRRREIDLKYDYRYSQLLFVFARLLREGRIADDDLEGFAADKAATIRHMASL